jgi:opacity protein-like surface antigen
MRNTVTRNVTALAAAVVTLAVLAVAPAAQAQDREGRWEFTLGTLYQLSTTLDVEPPNTAETDNDFGFEIGGAYNFTDNFAANLGLQWSGIGYDAVVFPEDSNITSISGSYDAFTLSANLVYNFTDNKLTPYIGAGIGWTWIDTNIPDGAPQTGCWWDPWWGYVCYTTYPTKTTDAFSYQATLGLRYTFDSDNTFMKLGYTSQWMDFDGTTSTPRFDVFTLDFGWIF